MPIGGQITNEPKDNPDKVGYERAKEELYCTIDPITLLRLAKLEALALAEGERRERERITSILEKYLVSQKGWISDFSYLVKKIREVL